MNYEVIYDRLNSEIIRTDSDDVDGLFIFDELSEARMALRRYYENKADLYRNASLNAHKKSVSKRIKRVPKYENDDE